MTYVKQCALIEAHDPHDWYERRRVKVIRRGDGYQAVSDGYESRHCHGKPISQRLGELAHERKL